MNLPSSPASPPAPPPSHLGPSDLRFDAAINPYGCSPAVVTALEQAVREREYRHYGDPDAQGLRIKLAAHHGLAPDNFAVYNGCGEGLVWQALTRLMLPRGSFICPFPSYERFVEIGRRAARQVIEVPLEPGARLPVDRFIDEARKGEARLAMLSSPNNPTGNRLLDEATLLGLLAALPGCTIVVDEAYAEYTRHSFAPLVSRWENLIVLKTFSKAYGLAGLRVGYVVGHTRAIAEARRYQIPWSVDSLALLAAQTALGDQEYLERTVSRIGDDVAWFGRALEQIPGFAVAPTAANFFFVRTGQARYDELAPRLARAGMVLRRRPDFPDHVRITSMTRPANQRLLEVLAG
jgi:histidinol-phosphate aminotransferase